MRYSLILLFFLCNYAFLNGQHNTQKNATQANIDTSQTKRTAPPPPPPPPSKKDHYFCVLEDIPRFPGCEGKGSEDEIKKCAEGELTKFLYKNLRYPTLARDNGIEGMCVVQFTVGKDGSVSDVDLVRDIGGGCGEESVRVVELMNKEGIKWTPGRARSRPCSLRFTLPVKFRLDHSNPKIVKQTVSPIKKKEEVQISSPSKMDIPKVEIQIRQFSISPNPSNGQFQLQFEAKAAPIILRIYNNLGQVIYYEYLGDFDGYYNHQIELQSQGVYFIRLEQNKQSFSRQFLIVKD